jgi:hypothetical protein
MAQHLIVIDLDHLHLHIVRNFGEDLWREFRYDKWASTSLEEADKATSQLRVTVRSTRRFRRIHARVLTLLQRHGLGKSSRVSVFQVQENN